MHNFTGLLLLAIACYGVLAQEQLDFKTVMKDCMQEHGVDPKEMENMKSGAMKAADVKDNTKCSMQCIMVKLGIMDANGKMMPDGVRKRFAGKDTSENIEKAISSCQNMKGANGCDTAYQMGTCMRSLKMDA